MSQVLERNAAAETKLEEPVERLAPDGPRLAAINGDRPLRILLPSYRSNPTTGGQGVYMRHVSKALAELGHQVDVISGPPYPVLDPRVNLIKLPSLDLYANPHPIRSIRPWMLGSPIDLFEWWSHATGGFSEPYTFGERMARYVRGTLDDYDVCHDNQTLCWGLLKMRDMGMPVVGTIHHPITMDRRIDIEHARTLQLKILKRRWYSFLNMQIKVARQLDPLIVVSESTRRDVVREFGVDAAKTKLVLHGIDHLQFRPMPHVKRRDDLIVACASADVPLKGLIYLIRAYAELLKTRPELKLRVIGKLREGNTSYELRQLGIMDKVEFVTGVTDEDITTIYNEATIAVSPSVYEGFGFPCGEAMSCGTPVIATNGGSLPEVVGDAGIVVPHSNPPALANAIAAMLDDPEMRAAYGQAGRERILAEFKWERAAREYADIYRQTIENADNRLERARA
ncbi:glycosyltransferase family 4 protein [Parvibaculum sp.]|jgi:glycosyltransferase involved in cell wall biosynthesis|uniref:glycosyltransferase family 4 protein n=3 Tax=Parvibaculum sp. TaxID=2024848 RepID=UPI001B1352BA|nr:glycosyltransferase family 4 protein [Parvibaculum sp.]MBO6635624.1 glycosyltransferase family 4 protein [Parvibaculum sp.]MBO6679816.1 glycosyltransferase family 4 protein [Parvibaculum sp.]MBO6905756.1 glycosyltransferase family 4 protein [Parvibaculum sp.]